MLTSALIIQGPILSIGRTGESLFATHQSLSEKYVKFDCTENINSIIGQNSKIFNQIILSTWSNESTKSLKEAKNFRILRLEDNLRMLPNLSNSSFYTGNNKLRQFYSTIKAIEELKKLDIDYCIKVRTDQFIDFKKLKLTVEKNINKLWVSTGANSPDNYVEDFFFGSSTENISNLCESMLKKRELYKSVHTDMFYSYLMIKPEIKNNFGILSFFPNDVVRSPNQSKLINLAWEKYFGLLPKEIYENQIWRGKKVRRVSVNNYYSNLKTQRPIKKNLSKYLFKLDFLNLTFYIFGYQFELVVKKLFKAILK